MKPAVSEKTGKPLPFAQQPREFQISEAVKGITGFVLIDRSGLTLDQKVDWYVEHDSTAGVLDAEAQAEVKEKILLRLLDGRETGSGE